MSYLKTVFETSATAAVNKPGNGKGFEVINIHFSDC